MNYITTEELNTFSAIEDEAINEHELKSKICFILKTLTCREREIIKLRYGVPVDGYTYSRKKIGKIFGISVERVRQIEEKAVRKLQHPSRSIKLEGFLDGTEP